MATVVDITSGVSLNGATKLTVSVNPVTVNATLSETFTATALTATASINPVTVNATRNATFTATALATTASVNPVTVNATRNATFTATALATTASVNPVTVNATRNATFTATALTATASVNAVTAAATLSETFTAAALTATASVNPVTVNATRSETFTATALAATAAVLPVSLVTHNSTTKQTAVRQLQASVPAPTPKIDIQLATLSAAATVVPPTVITSDSFLPHIPKTSGAVAQFPVAAIDLLSGSPLPIADVVDMRPISVAQELGFDYPFTLPVPELQYLFADAYLLYEDPSDYNSKLSAFKLPLRIIYVYGFGSKTSTPPAWAPTPSHAYDVVVTDADGYAVFDSTKSTDYRSRPWGSHMLVHEWILGESVLRLVHRVGDGKGNPTAPDFEEHMAPQYALLDPRTILRQPKRVKSIKIGSNRLTGHISLTGGFNVELTDGGAIEKQQETFSPIEQTTIRAGRRIKISASPGSGLGRYPGCGDVDISLRFINGVGPNAYGDFLLTPKDCVWYERPGTITNSHPRRVDTVQHTMQLHDNCKPCCECDDYVRVQKAMQKQFEKWRILAKRAERSRDIYADSRRRWLAQKHCREDNPQNLTIYQYCDDKLGIGYGFCNTTDKCRGPLDIAIKIEVFAAGGGGAVPSAASSVKLVPNTAKKSDPATGRMVPVDLPYVGGRWLAHWDLLNSRDGAKLVFMVQGCNILDGGSARVTVSATFAGKAYPDVVETSAFYGTCPSTNVC